jgi:hypothetical protein
MGKILTQSLIFRGDAINPWLLGTFSESACWVPSYGRETMNKDDVKRSARSSEDKEKPSKPTGDKKMSAGGTAGKLDESTKKGLGKTEDKIRDRLKG